MPRRSSRLAKKACHRTPAVAQAQNVLMRKLGFAQAPHLETDDFEKYLRLSNEGLTEE
jgi:hypothetical protein